MSVLSLITAKGQPVTLTMHAAGAYDPATGTASLTDTPVTTVGVVLPISRGLRYMAGSNIAEDDQQLLLPGSIAKPPVDTTATIGGKAFTIVEVSELAPAGEPLLYDTIIRGAS